MFSPPNPSTLPQTSVLLLNWLNQFVVAIPKHPLMHLDLPMPLTQQGAS